MSATLRSILTSSPYTIYEASALASIVTLNPLFAFSGVLFVVFGEGANLLEKQVIKKAFPNAQWTKRPNPPAYGCGIFPLVPKDGEPIKEPTSGMPSGHAQILTLAAVFWSLYLACKYTKLKRDGASASDIQAAWNNFLVSTSIMLFLVAVVMSQRVISGCHSVPQVLVGSVIGAALGFGTYAIATAALPNRTAPLNFATTATT